MTNKLSFLLVLCLGKMTLLSAAEYQIHSFKKIKVNDQFWAEGAYFGDFNKDGQNDVVSGPFWYEGPDFRTKHEYAPATESFKRKGNEGKEESVPGFEGALGTKNAYSENFLAFAYDINKDTWPDILILGFPGKESSWYENPKGANGHWQRHIVLDITDNESPTFADITGDGKPEIICNSEGYFGYAEPDWIDPKKHWKFHRVTPKGPWQRFTHGMGIGDVNGDGRTDLLEAKGWWEQSADPNAEWIKHPVTFGTGGAQMYVYDVDGDGDSDVITSIAAHGYGLAWFEQVKEGNEITFKEHIFMNKEPSENRYGIKFSQMHALDLIDFDGDGLKDIVTGKRFWAHGPEGDAEPNAPAVLYWFKLVRGENHQIDFVPHQIDNDSGVGTQVVAGRINNDAYPDLVVGNKKGVFVFLQEVKRVSKEEWEKTQPKPTGQ